MPGQTFGVGIGGGACIVAFNGGPDNCPARPENRRWWAEDYRHPSMEGRTIARPDTAGVH